MSERQGANARKSPCERLDLGGIGAIQPAGVLLGGRRGGDRIRLASRNTSSWLSQEPRSLLGRPLGEVVPVPREWLGERPGHRRSLAGLVEDAPRPLDGLLTLSQTGWLLDMEPTSPDVASHLVANPLLALELLEDFEPEPRSFEPWTETIQGQARPWDELDLIAARKLRGLIQRVRLGANGTSSAGLGGGAGR